MTDPADTFENRLHQLNRLVADLERGDIPLEDALKHYEQGIALIRACQEQLKHAEQTVQRLQQQNGEEHFTPFNARE